MATLILLGVVGLLLVVFTLALRVRSQPVPALDVKLSGKGQLSDTASRHHAMCLSRDTSSMAMQSHRAQIRGGASLTGAEYAALTRPLAACLGMQRS